MIFADKEKRREHFGVRAGTFDDLPHIYSILTQTIQDPYGSGNINLKEVRKEADRIIRALTSRGEGKILVAESADSVILGFAFFGKPDIRLVNQINPDQDELVELRLLYLNSAYRRQGIGSELLAAVEKTAKSENKTGIVLASGPRYINEGSSQFYRAAKYRLFGKLKNYFENQYPAYIFYKGL